MSTAFDGARDCFAGAFPASADVAAAFEFRRDDLAAVRRRVEEEAEQAGLPTCDVADFVLATSELAANSVVHGGGSGALRLWREPGRLLVEVEDRGSIEEPLVGRLRPRPTQVGGRGLWIANQLCDLVQIRSGTGGTRVRLRMALG
jgi:anti-sigma regulatory factor (Ser/Thr protein kinase)